MIRNIIITTIRFCYRHKAYSFTNIFGLSVGLATCILIFLYVQDELSYDKFLKDSSCIYRLEPYFLGEGEESHWAASQGNLLPSVMDRYPEILSGVKFHKSFGTSVLRYGDKFFREEGIIFADSSFFDVFSFDLVSGDPRTALTGPGKIVLTETTAGKYFGNEDAMGKILVSEQHSYVVSGIMKDVPANCHLQFGLLVSLDDLRSKWATLDQAGPSTFYSYIKLSANASLENLKKKVKQDIWSIYGYTVTGDSANVPKDYTADLILQPITSIHLKGHAEKELTANSDRQYIVIFSVVAFFVLVIACINYMNLATARSAFRGKEIGIKKVLGASRQGIFNQFMAESFVMTLLAMTIALALVAVILPSYNLITGKELELNILNIPLLLSLVAIWIIVSVLSGLYPAFFLSGFQPLKVLYSNSGSTGEGKRTLNFRRGLVVFQFGISILLIISSLTVFRQLQFIRQKSPGFIKENVIVLPLAGTGDPKKLEVYKNSLLSDPEVISTCGSSSIPGVRIHFLTIRLPDSEKQNPEGDDSGDGNIGIRTLSTDIEAVKTFGFEMASGRAFSQDYPNDPEEAFLLNEAAVKLLEIDDPIGKRIEYTFNLQEPKKGHIVGVVKDFHYESLHSEVEPLMIHIYPYYHRYLCIRFDSKDIAGLMTRIQDKWQAVFPDIPFDHFFLDTYYDNLYKSEINMSNIITYFTILAILIACLGLLGLASFITERRTREIGIRKVLGASSSGIVRLISKEFVWLLLISNFIAWFPAWYFLNRWLDGFVFRTDISWWIFLVSAVISMVTALTIVGIQSFRSSRLNPVEAIRAC